MPKSLAFFLFYLYYDFIPKVTIEESINHLFEEDWGIKSITEATPAIALNEQAVKITAMVNYHKDVVIPANIKVAKEQAAIASADGKSALLKNFFLEESENFYDNGADAFAVWYETKLNKTISEVKVGIPFTADDENVVIDGLNIEITVTNELVNNLGNVWMPNGTAVYRLDIEYVDGVREVNDLGKTNFETGVIETVKDTWDEKGSTVWLIFGKDIDDADAREYGFWTSEDSGDTLGVEDATFYDEHVFTFDEDGNLTGINVIKVTLIDARA